MGSPSRLRPLGLAQGLSEDKKPNWNWTPASWQGFVHSFTHSFTYLPGKPLLSTYCVPGQGWGPASTQGDLVAGVPWGTQAWPKLVQWGSASVSGVQPLLLYEMTDFFFFLSLSKKCKNALVRAPTLSSHPHPVSESWLPNTANPVTHPCS